MMRQFEDECVIARGIAALASGLLAGGLVVAWLLTSILLSALSLLLVIPLIACLRRQALAQRQNDRIRRGWTPPRIKITGVYRD
jgi:membrane protein implicated in regulation of membrane protease activity